MRAAILLALFAVATARVSYDGYQVWRLSNIHTDSRESFMKLINAHNVDVWSSGKGWVDVMVKPHLQDRLAKSFEELNIERQTNIEDLQTLVQRDYERVDSNNPKVGITFTQYNTFEEIEAYLAEVAASDSRTNLVSLGQSLEGRDLWQLQISVGAGKKAVWIDCGIHAREWITPATCIWGINYLLTGYGSDPDATALLDAYDVHILPVNNPDGYSYTWSDDRMWRKNRNHYVGDACVGIDLNRNFDDHFGGEGTSDNSCSQTYRGPSPASELETQAVQAAIDALAPNAVALFSIHSYSELWMYAFGWTSDLPPEAAELDRVTKIGVDALAAVNGIVYDYGPVSTTIYPAASTTVDYGYYAGIVHSYTLELRDKGLYGFELPESQIEPTATETWAGLIAAILAI